MLFEYQYNDITERKNTSGILAEVGTSVMTNKSIEYCSWKQSTAILYIFFTNELNPADKAILDNIVENCNYIYNQA